ncbi:MAG: hypothetical protein JJU24_10240 [Natronohydrobacter sp.]|nr:hypothetical protein [Natronohydrobacter sp.]
MASQFPLVTRPNLPACETTTPPERFVHPVVREWRAQRLWEAIFEAEPEDARQLLKAALIELEARA